MAKQTTTGFEIPEQMRDLAENNVEQARKAFDDFMAATQKAVSSMEDSASAVQGGALDFNKKALSYAEENVAKAFDFAQKAMKAGDVQDLLQIQNEFLRSQMASLGEQARDLSDSVTKTATDAAKKMGD